MRLFEAPKETFVALKAANIHLFSSEDISPWTASNPERVVVLPDRKLHELFLLDGFKKVIFVSHWFDGDDPQEEASYFFCGFDDGHPFVTQVDQEAWKAFIIGGPEGFFNILFPNIARAMGLANGRRQGDLWAFRFAGWKEVGEELFGEKAFGVAIDPRQVVDLPIGGTRHLVTGPWCEVTPFAMGNKITLMVAEGTVKAPNHPDLVLARPHLLAFNEHCMRGD